MYKSINKFPKCTEPRKDAWGWKIGRRPPLRGGQKGAALCCCQDSGGGSQDFLQRIRVKQCSGSQDWESWLLLHCYSQVGLFA